MSSLMWLAMSVMSLVAAGDAAPQGLEARRGVCPENLQGVRPRDAMAAALVQFGTERSQTFREALEDLRRARVIVYVQVEPGGMNTPQGSLRYVASSECFQWLLATVESGTTSISSTQANRVWLTALLGHELQHAREVADEPAIRSAQAFDAYFQAVGMRVGKARVDTAAARSMGRLVEAELRSFAGRTGQDASPALRRGTLTPTAAAMAPALRRRP